MKLKRKNIKSHFFLLVFFVFFILFNRLFLSPEPLVEGESIPLVPDPISENSQASLLVPQRIPDYTIEDLKYVSLHQSKRDWEIHAKRAFFFQKENITQSISSQAWLYGDQPKPTEILADKAVFNQNSEILQLTGNVKAYFPDGFVLETDQMFYESKTKRISVPRDTLVRGNGLVEIKSKVSFESDGLEMNLNDSKIYLPQNVHAKYEKNTDQKKEGVVTQIFSDFCVIDRMEKFARFEMNQIPNLPPKKIRIVQPEMEAYSKTAFLKYEKTKTELEYLELLQEVSFQEIAKKDVPSDQLRSGTAGKALFHSKENLITLSELPQVFQGQNTITGEVIRIYRDTDIVEVDYSNAYSKGKVQ